MELTQPSQRPSTVPAAYVSAVVHESLVGRLPAWSIPAPGRSALLAARGHQIEGLNVSAYGKFAGAGIPAVNTQSKGDVRGVPPRGKPV